MLEKHPDITVFGRPKSYNRFRVAVDIQNACNPSGVARELVRVIEDAMQDPQYTGTDYVRRDPAVVAVIDKLQSLAMLDPYKAHQLCDEALKETTQC